MRKEVIAQRDPKSPISEIFRTLRTNIQFMNANKKLKTILVTSTLSGEGKSWVTANLAVTFAQAGKKVVIIDADMRKGRQYAIFGVSPKPGLSNYLVDAADENVDLAEYIQETEIKNLYLIPAGNVPPNPSELLVTPQMVNLLDKMKQIADIVILDGTPSQLVTDALILTRIVDATIIVTSSGETKKENLKRVIDNIKNVGGKISGVVLNKVPISAKKYNEAFYYGSITSLERRKGKKNTELYNRTAASLKETRTMPDRANETKTSNIETRARRSENKRNTGVAKRTVQHSNVRKSFEESEELPKALQGRRKVNMEDKEDISLEKTTDILNEINKYLDEEKKKIR